MAKAGEEAEVSGRDGVFRQLAGGLARRATALLESVPGRVGTLIEDGVERLVGGLGRAVEGFLDGPGSSSGGLPPAGFLPPSPPPPAPIAPGCYSGGTSISGGSESCGGGAEKLFHGFAVLAPFSVVVPIPEIEVVWITREPLLPSAAPRPPNARPG